MLEEGMKGGSLFLRFSVDLAELGITQTYIGTLSFPCSDPRSTGSGIDGGEA